MHKLQIQINATVECLKKETSDKVIPEKCSAGSGCQIAPDGSRTTKRDLHSAVVN